MPYKSQAQRKFMHAQHPDIAARWDKEYPNQKGLPPRVKKKKFKFSVNNKLKGALGASEFKKGNIPTGKIQINVKGHKGDKAELASTIKHEMMHVKKPKATEKEVYKATAKTKISQAEQDKLISKLRNKTLNYKSGMIKRKLKMGPGENKPGDMISKVNELKGSITNNKPTISKKLLAIMGLV